MNNGIQPTVELATNNGNGFYPYPAMFGNSGFGNGGFGGYGSDIIWLIVILALFGGWGNNGNGFGGGNYGGIGENYVLATDFATIERKLDSVNSGICDATFALNNTMVNGFANTQQTLCQGFNGLNVAYLQGTNSLSSQIAGCCCDLRQQISDCCCTTQRGLDAINYNNVINTNAIQQTLCNNTRDIIENANMNYRALHEELVANKLEMKNDRIAEQQNEINALRLSASQAKQNAYLIDQLGTKCPIPAYLTCNPNAPLNYSINYGGCGCNGNF